MPDENRPTITTPAELDALPVGSIVRSAGGIAYTKTHGDEWRSAQSQYVSTLMLDPAIVTQPLRVLYVTGRDLLAEAEARGYERGKRDALTEAADAGETFLGRQGESGFAWDYLRARAAETPGGGA